MKLCLINPPHPYLKQPTSQAPLGLMYIAAAARSKGIEVVILDLSDRHYDDAFEIPEADLYGLTGTVLDRVPCQVVASKIKAAKQDSKIIVGGPISLTPQYIDRSVIDSVVVGEGEEIIIDIMNDLPALKDTYIANRIKNLDSIPFPARDLFSNLGGNIFAYNKNYLGNGSTVIITSRGCPNHCAFCASPGIWKRNVTFRSVENVLAEVDEITDKYGIHQLRFSDDNLTLDTKRLRHLCKELVKRDVIWRASIRVKPNKREMFEQMYEAGCREVSFGVESGDDDVLRYVNKGVTAEDNFKGLKNAKEAGMVVRVLFMCGTPGETEHTADRNIEFLTRADPYYDTIALTNFIPIPGSGIANDPSKYNCRVLDDNIDNYNFYMWGPSGLNDWKNFISINGLNDSVLTSNKNKLREFVELSGKSNKG